MWRPLLCERWLVNWRVRAAHVAWLVGVPAVFPKTGGCGGLSSGFLSVLLSAIALHLQLRRLPNVKTGLRDILKLSVWDQRLSRRYGGFPPRAALPNTLQGHCLPGESGEESDVQVRGSY